MTKILTVIAAGLVSTPALSHPGMEHSNSALHEALHLSGGFEPMILGLAVVGAIIAYKKLF